MNILDELQSLPIGPERTVPWAELRPHFPGRTDHERLGGDAVLAQIAEFVAPL
ncbi:MAG: hypothetical protein ACREU9_00025 [Gammaproteobacteria bacterium]